MSHFAVNLEFNFKFVFSLNYYVSFADTEHAPGVQRLIVSHQLLHDFLYVLRPNVWLMRFNEITCFIVSFGQTRKGRTTDRKRLETQKGVFLLFGSVPRGSGELFKSSPHAHNGAQGRLESAVVLVTNYLTSAAGRCLQRPLVNICFPFDTHFVASHSSEWTSAVRPAARKALEAIAAAG